MAARAILVGAVATAGGLLALGQLFGQPAAEAPRPGLIAARIESAPRLEAWMQPSVPTVAPAAAPPPGDQPIELLPDDRTAPIDVWSTPAEWSPAE